MLADVVGYSRMMGEDEEGTLARLNAHRKDFIEPTISTFHGTIVKQMGDGFLVEFTSAVNAVSCAIAIQKGMARRNRDIVESRQIVLRIGINLGDIISDGGDIFGDGVNVAARLEGLAKPGSICISGAVYDAIGNKLPCEYEFLGEQAVKNIAQPVRTYSVELVPGGELNIPVSAKPGGSNAFTLNRLIPVLAVIAIAAALYWLKPWQQVMTGSEKAGQEILAADPVTARPSIAVLPFDNMSGDVEQEYFSDGISEDIITGLSRLKNLAVIARNSSFTYKGMNVKAQAIGKDLGVRYVLEGSVRKAGDRVRINAQLVDTGNGTHLWAKKFDRKLTDVFAVQDEITQQIVTALSIQLTGKEQQQLMHNATNNFEAYDLFLQGQRVFAQMSREGLENAVELYKQSIRLDPGFARAYGALAVTMIRQAYLGFSSAPVELSERALDLAQKAVSIDPESPQALWALGYVYMIRKQFDDAITVLEKALRIAPNYADGYGLLALINNNIGRAEEAIRLIQKGMQLNPHYTYDYPYNLGRAYYALDDFDNAAKNLEQAVERNAAIYIPRLYLAASYIQLGRQDDAEWQIAELETLIPNSSISHWQKTVILADNSVRKRLFDDLSKAGMAD